MLASPEADKKRERNGKSSMSILNESKLAIRYVRPFRSLIAINVSLLLILGLIEGIGLGMVIPILQSISSSDLDNPFVIYTTKVFEFLGINYGIIELLSVFAIIMMVKFLLQAVQRYFSRYISASLTRDLQNRSFVTLVETPLAFFQNRRVGDTVTTIFTSSQNSGAAVENLFNVAVALVFCSVYLTLNLFISAELTLIAVGLVCLSAVLIVPRVRTGFRVGRAQKEVFDDQVSFLMDKIGGIKTVKAFMIGNFLARSFDLITKRYLSTALKIQLNRIIADLLLEPLVTLLAIGLTMYAILYLEIELVLLIGFFIVLLRMVPQMKLVNSGWLEFVGLLPHFSKVHELIEHSDEYAVPDGSKSIASFSNLISFEEVSFSHSPADLEVLDKVSLEIPKNTFVAIVGESGSGKSTLIDLIIGHHQPTTGRIRVDGIDLKEISYADWNKLISIVDQEAHLFNTTIAENIKFGNLNATLENVRDAARRAYAIEFIEAMPDGFDTAVGDRGTRLSGGQRQRIALARALVRDPQILILDEATSALDSESERQVQEAISRAVMSKTVIVVAHRLSTVQHADKIVVLDKGRVVGEGTHEELFEGNQIYRNYVQLQFVDKNSG